MDLKDLKKLLDCSEEYITTLIKFKLNGECTNANLVTVMQNKNVKEQFVLYKGKRTKLSTIGTFEDGYCTCCEKVIVTPGGSSSSGSGGAGIGGGLVEAWANAKLFNTQSDNQFFCGGQFRGVKAVNFNNNLWIEFNYLSITANPLTIQVFDNSNNLQGTFNIPLLNSSGTTTLTMANIPQSQIGKIVISASTYSSGSNPLCTNGQVTFTP